MAKGIGKEIEELERRELRELKKIEEEIHYGTKELITGVVIGIVIGFMIAAIFL
ncbi:MAG: hypothetical protein KKE20_02805 [Nanoarchaeota archaeon]|nr:hypothetical protein [Nanoarchaeota archaeon]